MWEMIVTSLGGTFLGAFFGWFFGRCLWFISESAKDFFIAQTLENIHFCHK